MPFDERHIDPDPGLLVRALRSATRSANDGQQERRLEKQSDFWVRFLRRVRSQPEGWQRWVGGRGGRPAPLVEAAWWTDPVGRKHWRIQGRRLRWDEPSNFDFARFSLWRVYPNRLMLRERDGRFELLGVCRCGAAGPVETLAWMGECCGPCHDRKEEGLPPLPGPDWPMVLPKQNAAQILGLTFTDDGRLLSSCAGGWLVRWDLETGSSEILLHWHRHCIFPLAVSSTGAIAVGSSDGLVLLRQGEGDWREVPLPWMYVHSLAFSPAGDWLAVAGTGCFLVDLGGVEPSPLGVLDGDSSSAVAFGPDGRSYWMVTTRGEVVRLDAGGEGRTVLHSQLVEATDYDFQMIYEGGSDHLRCSPDGRWLAVVSWWLNEGLYIYDLTTGIWSHLADMTLGATQNMAFTSDDKLVCGDCLGSASLLDPTSGRMLGRLHAVPEGTDHLRPAFSADGALLALGTGKGIIHVVPLQSLLEV
jgi:hypothetical protein